MNSNLFLGVTQPKTAAKGWVAVAGTVIQVALYVLNQASPFLHGNALAGVSALIGVLTFVGVYFVPNADPSPAPGSGDASPNVFSQIRTETPPATPPVAAPKRHGLP